MDVCAVAPAKEPAMNRCAVSILSPSGDRYFLYWKEIVPCQVSTDVYTE